MAKHFTESVNTPLGLQSLDSHSSLNSLDLKVTPSSAFKGSPLPVKADQGKQMLDLLPVKPLLSVGDAFTYGANKYKPRNWEPGKEIDPESGVPHLAHAISCLLMLLEYYYTGAGEDDRNVYPSVGGVS